MTLAALESSHIFIIVLSGIGMVIALTAILFGTIRSMVETRSRERSRSEIAAYIAEGSMTADEGERILKAEPERPADDDE